MPAITTSPSMTALAVIGSFARGQDTADGAFFNDIDFALARHICHHAIELDTHIFRRGLIKIFHHLPYRLQSKFFDKWISPGYDTHMMKRKRWVKDTLEQAIRDGAQHIIILGGGYDPRALLAAQQYPHVKFYELDRGRTRHIKLNSLQNLPSHLNISLLDIVELNHAAFRVNDKLFFIECDLRTDDLIKTLTTYGYQPTEKTLIIAEGLTMYLTHAHIHQLLADFHTFFTHESQFLISFLTSAPQKYSFHSLAVNSVQEAYQTVLMPEEVLSLVTKMGLKITSNAAIENHPSAQKDPYKTAMQENYFLLQKK